jgi:cell wall-associated NlpC family hydrolase
MFVRNTFLVFGALSALMVLAGSPACADEIVAASPTEVIEQAVMPAASPAPIAEAGKAATGIDSALKNALDLIGIRYRRGGNSPTSGFDCSGFVSHVFHEGLGLYLPHSAKAMSKTGSPVERTALKPGDLVFFTTVRKTISHVGIYLGDNLFVHAPRRGGKIRIDDMDERYWTKRFRGARRVAVE